LKSFFYYFEIIPFILNKKLFPFSSHFGSVEEKVKLPLHSPDAKSYAPDDSEANRLGEILHQTGGSVVDPNPHGSAFIWLSWIQIHIGTADPDMAYFSCNIFTFIDQDLDSDPDPQGSALVWLTDSRSGTTPR
jgi:hypothetical protein